MEVSLSQRKRTANPRPLTALREGATLILTVSSFLPSHGQHLADRGTPLEWHSRFKDRTRHVGGPRGRHSIKHSSNLGVQSIQLDHLLLACHLAHRRRPAGVPPLSTPAA